MNAIYSTDNYMDFMLMGEGVVAEEIKASPLKPGESRSEETIFNGTSEATTAEKRAAALVAADIATGAKAAPDAESQASIHDQKAEMEGV